jgi:hypothetical protein
MVVLDEVSLPLLADDAQHGSRLDFRKRIWSNGRRDEQVCGLDYGNLLGSLRSSRQNAVDEQEHNRKHRYAHVWLSMAELITHGVASARNALQGGWRVIDSTALQREREMLEAHGIREWEGEVNDVAWWARVVQARTERRPPERTGGSRGANRVSERQR